jgi:hypothetical protein
LKRKAILKTLLPPAAAMLNVSSALAADPPQAPSQMPAIAGWSEFVETLRTLPDKLLAKLPESMRTDPRVQQEVGRLILESVASQSIDAIGGDPDHPVFLPAIGLVLNVGQPNADTVYKMARVDSRGIYRLRGRRGSLRIFSIGQTGPTPGERGATNTQVGPMRGFQDLNALPVDAQGDFDLLLSATRPKGYSGEWWELYPETNKLLLRAVSSNWGHEQDPTIAIERLDIPVERPRSTQAELEQRLRTLPRAITFMAAFPIDQIQRLRDQGFINKLKVMDISQSGGLQGQYYYDGAYDLADDEALLLEAKVPAKCTYRSLILTNEIYETTDWYNNHSSLNDSQAHPDKDGVLRIVVASKDPGVPNWLDTAGYPQGLVQGRWYGCDAQPVPTMTKVKFADLRKSLPLDTPVVTPAQRQEIIRARRLALLQRSLW